MHPFYMLCSFSNRIRIELNLGLYVDCFPNWIQKHLANHSHCKRLSVRVHGFFLNDPINFKVVVISVLPKVCAFCALFQITHRFLRIVDVRFQALQKG